MGWKIVRLLLLKPCLAYWLFSRVTVKDDSGRVIFNLRKDPLSNNEETEMLDDKGKIIATCERERLEKTAYITVKENGEITVYSKKIDW